MTSNVEKFGQVGNSSIAVGRFTYGFENVAIRQFGEGACLKIGAFCSIAWNVTVFLGGNHRVDWITTFPFGHIFQDELGGESIKGHPATKGDVTIGNDVWIGAGVTIMSGVTIGDGAVLSANANIVKDVLPYHIVGGNPGQHIKPRFDDVTITLLLRLKWWELDVREVRAIASQLCTTPKLGMLQEMIEKYRNAPDAWMG